MKCTVLNAGEQTDYLFGFITGLAQHRSLAIDVIDGSASAGLFSVYSNVQHLNYRGDNRSPQSIILKLYRILRYYICLFLYVPRSTSTIFHIQWDNSFYLFDRTLLLLYYKMFGKILVYTVHNIDRKQRDTQRSPFLNRLSLWCAYHIVDHLITHTERMKEELCYQFGVPPDKVTVIPHGVNIFVPSTGLTTERAREQLAIHPSAKVLLFFGMIDWYKGLDIALEAFTQLHTIDSSFFFLIAGQPKRSRQYYAIVRSYAQQYLPQYSYFFDARFIPRHEVEQYFVAADCVLLPYRTIFQSGILFLAYRFGVPVIATDVGSFRDDIIEGKTGFLCEPDSPRSLGEAIMKFFKSDLYIKKNETRVYIQTYASQRYSWYTIGATTYQLYQQLLKQ
ncbi:MAG: glycosyltransferase family 4 protein [Bacteroidetes bacterium]|nr:glycosyltransferase family 4 protein [Bacteroidota bacterium]